MISVTSSGSFGKTEAFLSKISKGDLYRSLDQYGRMGVTALAKATPKETGETGGSWSYKVSHTRGQHTIEWHNTNIVNGTSIAIILQYGHGTGTGGWVEGRDYINPAIQPIFDKISEEIWKKVIANG